MARLEPNLYFWGEQNLQIVGRVSRYCVVNATTQDYTAVDLEVIDPFLGVRADFETFPNVSAGSRVCKDTGLDVTPLRGVAQIRLKGTLGAESDVYTNSTIVMIDTDYAPAFFLDKPKFYRFYALYKGVWYGGLYYSDQVPRPRNADAVYLETIDGETALWTRDEVASGNLSFGGRAWKLEVAYQFPSLQAIASYLESLAGRMDTFVNLDALTPSQKIDLLLPLANFRLKGEQFTPLIEVDKASRVVKFTYMVTAGLPLLPVVIAGFIGLGILTIGATLYISHKIEQATATDIAATAEMAKTIIENQKAIAQALIDILDTSVMRVSKDEAKAIIAQQAETSKQEIDKIKETSIANAFGLPQITTWDKLKYAGIGALAGAAGALILRGR